MLPRTRCRAAPDTCRWVGSRPSRAWASAIEAISDLRFTAIPYTDYQAEKPGGKMGYRSHACNTIDARDLSREDFENLRTTHPSAMLFGFIPWKRQSTAYGFSQALNGTWSEYKSSTGNLLARRTKFSDAIHFVAWYHNKNSRKNGIARNDAYNLYLAYYLGDAGYRRGAWRGNTQLLKAAQRSANIANAYARQLRSCN